MSPHLRCCLFNDLGMRGWGEVEEEKAEIDAGECLFSLFIALAVFQALDKYWHEDCLKCACCDCRLGEVGSTLYTKANLILCRRDYLRLFGVTGNCAACSKLIPAFEMVMRAKDNVYHLDCFACQLCNQRFCVGDKFFLKNNMILCQTDYEEGLMKEGYAPQVR
uniref:LIM domain only protein 3 n=1 Tax=Anas platyrhynchos platyrhynchos TaxID=8840 RepID=A0A493T473_ANAPP